MLENILNADQWIDFDAAWVVTSHHVLDMSAMMWLPWQRHRTFCSYGRLEAESVNQF